MAHCARHVRELSKIRITFPRNYVGAAPRRMSPFQTCVSAGEGRRNKRCTSSLCPGNPLERSATSARRSSATCSPLLWASTHAATLHYTCNNRRVGSPYPARSRANHVHAASGSWHFDADYECNDCAPDSMSRQNIFLSADRTSKFRGLCLSVMGVNLPMRPAQCTSSSLRCKQYVFGRSGSVRKATKIGTPGRTQQ